MIVKKLNSNTYEFNITRSDIEHVGYEYSLIQEKGEYYEKFLEEMLSDKIFPAINSINPLDNKYAAVKLKSITSEEITLTVSICDEIDDEDETSEIDHKDYLTRITFNSMNEAINFCSKNLLSSVFVKNDVLAKKNDKYYLFFSVDINSSYSKKDGIIISNSAREFMYEQIVYKSRVIPDTYEVIIKDKALDKLFMLGEQLL